MKVGEKFVYMGDVARIMAIAEGYVMARKKGCFPFLVTVKEAVKHSAQADSAMPSAKGTQKAIEELRQARVFGGKMPSS